MIDKVAPTVPGVTTGAGAWSNAASVAVAPTVGSTDAGGSGLAANPYNFRTSTNLNPGNVDGTHQRRLHDDLGRGPRPRSSSAVPTSPEMPRRGRLRSRCGSTAPPQRSRFPPIPAIPTSGWSKSTTTVTGTPDSSGSPVTLEVYRLGTSGSGSACLAPGSPCPAQVSAAGTTVVEFQATDAAGNISAWTAPTTVKLDLTSPTTPTVSGGSLSWKLGPTPFTASGSTDSGGSGLGPYQYPDLDRQRRDMVGDHQCAGGRQRQRHHDHDRPDARYRQRRQRLGMDVSGQQRRQHGQAR